MASLKSIERKNQARAEKQIKAESVPRYTLGKYVNTVRDLAKLAEKGKLVYTEIPSDYTKSSRIIEALFMGAILPNSYASENMEGRYVLHSKSALIEDIITFFNGEWSLDFGFDNHPLQGFNFNELPPVLQNRLEDTEMTFVIIPHKDELLSVLKEIMNA